MCNGWNHRPGCDCGFGPPYSWSTTSSPPESWIELSLQNGKTYKRHLRNLGLSRNEIDEEFTRYRKHDLPMSTENWDSLSMEEKTDWKTRFLTVFGLYRYEEVQQTEKKIDIPIFKLHSPNVENSKVTYETEVKTAATESWSVTILGFGTGNSQVFRLVNTSEFSSEAGACKLVRLPVILQLTWLNLYQRNKFLRKVLKVEPSPKYEHEIMNQGVKLQEDSICRPDLCSTYKPSQVYPLAEESPTSISKYTQKWDSETEKGFSAGVEAFNLKGQCQAKVRREIGITLTICLPGGHDYRMFRLKEPDGLVWETVGK